MSTDQRSPNDQEDSLLSSLEPLLYTISASPLFPPQILALVEPLGAKLSPAGPGLPLPVLSWRLWAIDARGSTHRDDCPVPCRAASETYSLAHLFAFLLFASGCEIQSVSPHHGYESGLTPRIFFLKPCIFNFPLIPSAHLQWT